MFAFYLYFPGSDFPFVLTLLGNLLLVVRRFGALVQCGGSDREHATTDTNAISGVIVLGIHKHFPLPRFCICGALTTVLNFPC